MTPSPPISSATRTRDLVPVEPGHGPSSAVRTPDGYRRALATHQKRGEQQKRAMRELSRRAFPYPNRGRWRAWNYDVRRNTPDARLFLTELVTRALPCPLENSHVKERAGVDVRSCSVPLVFRLRCPYATRARLPRSQGGTPRAGAHCRNGSPSECLTERGLTKPAASRRRRQSFFRGAALAQSTPR